MSKAILAKLKRAQDGVPERLSSRKEPVSDSPVDIGAIADTADLAVRKEREALSRIRVYEIDVFDIAEQAMAQRFRYKEEEIDQMCFWLKADGQREPVHLRRRRDGGLTISDGWTRVLSCIDLVKQGNEEFQKIKAIIHDGMSSKEGFVFGWKQNEQRRGHTNLDKAFALKKLIDGTDEILAMTRREASEVLAISDSEATKLLSFTELPEEVIEIIAEDPTRFGKEHGYMLSKIFEDHGLAKCIEAAKLVSEGLSVKKLNDLKNEKDGKPTVFDLKFGSFSLKKNGFEVKVKGSSDEEALALREKIELAIRTILSEG